MVIVGRFLVDGKERCAIVEEGAAYLIEGDMFGSLEKTGEKYQVSNLAVLPPVKPNKIIGIYSNYRSSVMNSGNLIPEEPPMFFKANSTVIGGCQEIIVPRVVQQAAYEAEMAFVIKKKARNVKAKEAGEYILGYTGANDVTAKNFICDGPWAKAKCFDTFQPLGEYLVITDDFKNIPVSFKLNGELTQNSDTNDFIFSPGEVLEYMSSMMTLDAGDVILTGTPAGAGILSNGDICEVVVGYAGCLVNKVTFE